ncbi:MAG: acetyltransferase [Spongiibacteraceae bacterium]|nr:acetyltransferase [Spongiibacteraceae bacterium]MBN4055380.1 acetyltransferase [bacterium AH-315-K03]
MLSDNKCSDKLIISNACEMHLQALNLDTDITLIHSWYIMDYAYFWGMQNHSVEGVRAFYKEEVDSGHLRAYLGYYENTPSFVMEVYAPELDEISQLYQVQPGDVGMHFFVGPATKPIPNFTLSVIKTIMAYLFYEKKAKRIVVEPDIRNKKVHRLNNAVGFVDGPVIQMKDKVAQLAFCTRNNFEHSLQQGSAIL